MLVEEKCRTTEVGGYLIRAEWSKSLSCHEIHKENTPPLHHPPTPTPAPHTHLKLASSITAAFEAVYKTGRTSCLYTLYLAH